LVALFIILKSLMLVKKVLSTFL